MEKIDKEKITKYLRSKKISNGNYSGSVICFDMIDKKEVSIDFIIDSELYITGDDSEVYDFDDLELIDGRVFNFCNK